MAADWIATNVGSQATLQRGVDITKLEQRPGSVPVISSGGVSSYHDTPAASGPGVILGRKGIVGSVYFVECDYWPHDTTLWVKDFHGNDPRFVYYFFRWMAPRIATMDVGSANPTLNRNHVHPIEIRWPPLSEQRAVARILGTLDDKIELNRQMSETLEAIARSLYKSWFVDFDPVSINSQGRERGLPKLPADLLSNSFQSSDLGEIPNGWSSVPIYDLAKYINGAAYAAFRPNSERRGLPIIKIAELKAGVTAQTKFSDVQMPDKYRIDNGDILFSWSGNPDTSIDTFVWSNGPGWLNQHIFNVRPFRVHERAFVLSTLKTLRPVFAEIARNKQTTGLGHITVEDLKRLNVAKPDDRLTRAWEAVASPIHERIFQNALEINTLSRIRDALLPQLITGEQRVELGQQSMEATA